MSLSLACIEKGREEFAKRLGGNAVLQEEDWSHEEWVRKGRYHGREMQRIVRQALDEHERILVGLAILGYSNGEIGRVLEVSREAVAQRLRPRGFNVVRGAAPRSKQRVRVLP